MSICWTQILIMKLIGIGGILPTKCHKLLSHLLGTKHCNFSLLGVPGWPAAMVKPENILLGILQLQLAAANNSNRAFAQASRQQHIDQGTVATEGVHTRGPTVEQIGHQACPLDTRSS